MIYKIMIKKLPVLIVVTGLLFIPLITGSCATPEEDMVNEKVSSQLLTQINLKGEQLADPTPERLEIMKTMGMNTDNLKIQRIFIHSLQALSPSQIEEIEALGITIYPDSWIPPVGSHPTGFVLADMPLDSLNKLTQFEYVARLETAERQFQPQNGATPQ